MLPPLDTTKSGAEGESTVRAAPTWGGSGGGGSSGGGGAAAAAVRKTSLLTKLLKTERIPQELTSRGRFQWIVNQNATEVFT